MYILKFMDTYTPVDINYNLSYCTCSPVKIKTCYVYLTDVLKDKVAIVTQTYEDLSYFFTGTVQIGQVQVY